MPTIDCDAATILNTERWAIQGIRGTSVIPACFKRESRRVRSWTPDKSILGWRFWKKYQL